MTILDPPGPPQNPQTSDITKTSCVLSWEAPLDDGGSPVLGYHIERRFGDSPRWLQINSERVDGMTYKAVDLVDEYEYEFRVLAVNKVNIGQPSVPTQPIVPKDPFSKLQVHVHQTVHVHIHGYCACMYMYMYHMCKYITRTRYVAVV